jgi:hypothetical protein
MKNFFLLILIFFVVGNTYAQPQYTFENHTQRSYTNYTMGFEGTYLIEQFDFHKQNGKELCEKISFSFPCFYHYQFDFLKKEIDFKTIPGDMFILTNRTHNSSKYFFHRKLGEVITNGYNFIYKDRFDLNSNSNFIFYGPNYINNARFVDIVPQNQDSSTFITLGTYRQPINDNRTPKQGFNFLTLIRNTISTNAFQVNLIQSDTIFRARDYFDNIKNTFKNDGSINNAQNHYSQMTNATFAKKSPIDFKKDYYYALFTFWANKCVFVNDSNGMYLRDTMTYLYDTLPSQIYNRGICFATNADGYYQVISDNQFYHDQQFDFFKLTKDEIV